MADFKTFRKLNKLTQQQAAEYFGCLQSFISQIETGRSAVPEAFISKILVDGKYILPTNMSKTTEGLQVEESAQQQQKVSKVSEENLKYIEALESLLSYKDKEIAELKALKAELESKIARLQRTTGETEA